MPSSPLPTCFNLKLPTISSCPWSAGMWKGVPQPGGKHDPAHAPSRHAGCSNRPISSRLNGVEVQRFNQMDKDELRRIGPDVQPEIERVFAVTTPQADAGDHHIYLAGEVVDALLNARAWNREVATPVGRGLWGRRRVQYFVAVPIQPSSHLVNSSPFLPIRREKPSSGSSDTSRMTLQLYVQLDESEPRFDGNVAQRHLTRRLGMVARTPAEDPQTTALFQQWLTTVADLITVPARGPVFLLPPDA